MLSHEVLRYIQNSQGELLELVKTLSRIPAPSWNEGQRAEFILSWLKERGIRQAYMDEAMNVLIPFPCENGTDLAVFAAHTDIVFPDTEPLPCREEDGRLYAPGVGDDTAQVAVLLMMAKYLSGARPKGSCGVLLAANTGEEGMGNLKGTREIWRAYGDRIKIFHTFDGPYRYLMNRSVGSHRYRVCIRTQGGHSYDNFGNRNAIACMAELIQRLYRIQVPEKPGTKTTYNVGQIQGGTSVNTIAETAEMLCEYRSDDNECLREMQAAFLAAFEASRRPDAELSVELIGERPGMGPVDPAAMEALTARCREIYDRYVDVPYRVVSGSTDANIAHSHGVPGICVGTNYGEGLHTRGEWIRIDSLPIGMKIAAELILPYFEEPSEEGRL